MMRNGTSAFGQDRNGLEAKPAGPVGNADAPKPLFYQPRNPTMTDIPTWANERRRDLVDAVWRPASESELEGTRAAFAAYIAATETAPIDPLLLEARDVCASQPGVSGPQAQAYRDGNWDKGGPVDLAYAALRRGIELGREQSA